MLAGQNLKVFGPARCAVCRVSALCDIARVQHVDYQFNHAWRFGLQARAQGDYYIEESNEQGKYGGFAVLDANVRYQLSDTTSLDLQLKNLTDRDYEYVWFDNFFWGGDDQPMFSPAPGRSAYLSVNMKL